MYLCTYVCPPLRQTIFQKWMSSWMPGTASHKFWKMKTSSKSSKVMGKCSMLGGYPKIALTSYINFSYWPFGSKVIGCLKEHRTTKIIHNFFLKLILYWTNLPHLWQKSGQGQICMHDPCRFWITHCTKNEMAAKLMGQCDKLKTQTNP